MNASENEVSASSASHFLLERRLTRPLPHRPRHEPPLPITNTIVESVHRRLERLVRDGVRNGVREEGGCGSKRVDEDKRLLDACEEAGMVFPEGEGADLGANRHDERASRQGERGG